MGLIKWLFGNGWEKLNEESTPNWVWKMLRNSAYDINYYKGKTFIYKGLKIAGNRQGEYNYQVYRKLKKS